MLQTIAKAPVKILELDKEMYGELPSKVIEGIVDVGMDAFGAGMTREEVLDHIYPTDRLYLASSDGNLVGFSTGTLKKQSVDLVGAAVRPREQGRGIYSSFGLRRINMALDHGRSIIELRTQNPKIEIGMKRCLDVIVDMGVIDGYSVEREKRTAVYGRMLTDKRPLSGTELDQLYDVLDYGAGDTFAFQFRMEK